jgi:hypothetical protein
VKPHWTTDGTADEDSRTWAIERLCVRYGWLETANFFAWFRVFVRRQH